MADEKSKKPKCKLSGENGNIFNLIGIASATLVGAGQGNKADEMTARVFKSGGYDKALAIICEYVDAR